MLLKSRHNAINTLIATNKKEQAQKSSSIGEDKLLKDIFDDFEKQRQNWQVTQERDLQQLAGISSEVKELEVR